VALQRASEHLHFAVLRDPLVEVLTGTEGPAGSRQQQRAARSIAFRRIDGLAQGMMHGLAKRVEPLRSIERNDVIASATLGQNGLFIHGKFLPAVMPAHAAGNDAAF